MGGRPEADPWQNGNASVSVCPRLPVPMRSNSNLAMTILLNIVGVMLVLTAILLLLRGLGWINQIPSFVVWSLVLAAVGIGILGGVRSHR